MTQKNIFDLRCLFYINNNGSYRKRLNKPVDYDYFKEILINTVNKLNLNAPELFFIHKYETYLSVFERNVKNIMRRELIELGFFSKTTTNINYYLTRGWSFDDSKKLLRERQTVKLSEESKEKRAKIFSTNYYNNKHKKFLRPSEILYWMNKGFDEKAAKQKMFEYYSYYGRKFHEERRERGEEFLTVRQLQYWLNLGFPLKEAKEELRKIQDRRSLNYFITKYGEEEGNIRFNKIINKWLTTLNSKSEDEKSRILISKTKNLKRYSNVSVDLFDGVLNILERENVIFDKVYYKENEYYIYDNDCKKIYFYDLTIKDINLIVEFNGSVFHPNKNELSKNEWDEWINPITKRGANYHYEYDLQKQKTALKRKFNYLIVWDDKTFEYNCNKILNKIYSLL